MDRVDCVVTGEGERNAWSGQQFVCLVCLFIAVEGIPKRGASASVPDLKRPLTPSSYEAKVITIHHELVYTLYQEAVSY
jgi:hypothetical protein